MGWGRGEGCGTLTEAVGVGVLKLSEKEAAKHIAASMVTANVATALARCPNECILSRLRFLPHRAAAAEIAGPPLPPLLLLLPPVAAAPATSTAVSFSPSSFSPEEREVSPCRSP